MINIDLLALRNQQIGELKAYSVVKDELELTVRQRDILTDLRNARIEYYNTREVFINSRDYLYSQTQNPTPDRLTEPHRPTRTELAAAFGWGIAIFTTIGWIFY